MTPVSTESRVPAHRVDDPGLRSYYMRLPVLERP